MSFNAVYCDALGDFTSIDDLNSFLHLFDDPDPDLWVGATGELGIWREAKDGTEQAMVMSYVPKIGFTIQSADANSNTRVARDGDNDEPIFYDVGGETAQRPRSAFVDSKRAKAIAAQFIVDGTLCEAVEWVSPFDL